MRKKTPKELRELNKVHPEKIRQANRVADKFGEFTRESLCLFDYITSCINSGMKMQPHTPIEVNFSELYNFLYGGKLKKNFTDKQVNKFMTAIDTMLRTPLKTRIGKRYLFEKSVNFSATKNSEFQNIVFKLSNDTTAIGYFYDLRKDYYTCTLPDIVSIEGAMGLKVYKFILSELKANNQVTIYLDLSNINRIFKSNKKPFEDLNHATRSFDTAFNNLRKNAWFDNRYTVSYHTTRDKKDGRKAGLLVISVIDLENKKSSDNISKPDTVYDILQEDEDVRSVFNHLEKEDKHGSQIKIF